MLTIQVRLEGFERSQVPEWRLEVRCAGGLPLRLLPQFMEPILGLQPSSALSFGSIVSNSTVGYPALSW